MNTHEIIYFSIFMTILIVGSLGSGFLIRHVWFKCQSLIERTQKWRRNGGKW